MASSLDQVQNIVVTHTERILFLNQLIFSRRIVFQYGQMNYCYISCIWYSTSLLNIYLWHRIAVICQESRFVEIITRTGAKELPM